MKRYYTDEEVLYHRFCHKNIHKNIGTICKELGMTQKQYKHACIRAMETKRDSAQ